MASKWMTALSKMDGAVNEERDPFEKVAQTASPSVNFIFGKSWGLPLGYTAMLYGPPKEGKSVLSHMFAGHLQQNDPEAIVVKFDSEFRTRGQLRRSDMALFGIDPDRFQSVENNTPSGVFDQIEQIVGAQCAKGAPIKMIIVDSISSVQGRREMNTESVEKHTIGDHAQTIQIGLKRILPIIRKYDIALILIVQARAEMDMLEQKRGNKYKMQAGFGLQHMAEYFISVDRNKNKAGRADLSGREFINEELKDLADRGEQTAIKIRVKMKDSSMGPVGRLAEFTFHFHHGIVSQHEEVYKLGSGRGVIEEVSQGRFAFGDQKWHGEKAVLEALEADPELQKSILAEVQRRDEAGEYNEADAKLAKQIEASGEEGLEDEESDEE